MTVLKKVYLNQTRMTFKVFLHQSL